ncbi:hypothetical protein BHE74_00036709 [Ensete ventricosum]|nr:hypothetical protein BHE74_00036709 [Ensete ventricosum]
MASMTDRWDFFSRRCAWVNRPIIVEAGPSGLAVAACLKEHGVPSVILERADCIASLWQKRTYDRLKLHLPKQLCQLPKFPFPEDYPEYPTKKQFVDYLESYAKHFEISPRFNQSVQSARYDETCGLWRVRTVGAGSEAGNRSHEVEDIGRWLVVATGENAEKVVPELEGLGGFGGWGGAGGARAGGAGGGWLHACDYKSGEAYRGKRVLVIGCGNSGMELCLDLCDHDAFPAMVVRDSGGSREVDVRACRSADEVAAAVAGGQDPAAVGMAGAGERREVWPEEAFHRSPGAQGLPQMDRP